MALQQLISYNFENLNYEKDEDQYIPKTDVVFVLKNVLIDNIFYFNKDKSKIPKASIVIDKHMKNKLKELYNKKPSKLKTQVVILSIVEGDCEVNQIHITENS